jgi:arylsulfatase A-like enzyme
MRDTQFLIVGLDGLRADMVTPELTPNLLRLARRGVLFRQHHAVFPTATRVNVASLVTGANSGTHGIVNNSIFEPSVAPNGPLDLGQYDQVEAANGYYGGALLHTPSLGEVLAAHGETLIAVSSGTTGSNRLMHHQVKTLGGIGFSAHGPEACHPASEAKALVDRFGPVPPAATPDTARLAYITDVCLERLLPVYLPRVAILWFSDPDKTYHHCGIGSPESLAAIRGADAQLGRIMDWLELPPQRHRINLVVLSDHGHVTIRQQVSVCDALNAMGVSAAIGRYDGGEVAVVPWCSGSIHVRNHDPQLTRKIVAWMQEQPWCGPLFTRGKNAIEGVVPGTLARSLVLNEHPRAGDIVYVMRADEEQDEHGITGGCYDDSGLALGGGTHGGLSRHELRNVCVACGPAFHEGKESSMASGTVDLLPTILHLLGYAVPPRADGRILYEALAQTTAPAEPVRDNRTYSTEAQTAVGLYRQQLTVTTVGETAYLEHGWVE